VSVKFSVTPRNAWLKKPRKETGGPGDDIDNAATVEVVMDYWEKVFMGLGIGTLVGVIINFQSLPAVPAGVIFIVIGFAINKLKNKGA